MSEGLKLDNIIFTGRTYDEYTRMFNLSQEDMKKYTFFVCPGGASSFTTQANKLGYRVRAGDKVYGSEKEQLAHLGQASIDTIRSKMKEATEGYHWGEFGDIEGLLRVRSQSLSEFLSDYEIGLKEKRYMHCTLPQLPLPDGSADIVLSDHLLFTYPQFFDIDFHLTSIGELIRIAKYEVRLFPLISSASGTRPAFFDQMISRLHELGYRTTIDYTPNYHFQVGSNEMLRIYKGDAMKQTDTQS